jgi:aminoglycoside phosphotransferase (APT) family kinase protein
VTVGEPEEAAARRLAAAATGRRVLGARRFPTGSHHYVYEVALADAAPVVVRIGKPEARNAMVGAAELSRRLRPAGVPLPAVIAADTALPFPHLVLERLPGTDLGHVIGTLPPARLDGIAVAVARAQAIVATTGTAGRYGYAVEAAAAPRMRWSEVLGDNLERSRRRLRAAGLFDTAPVAAMAKLIEDRRSALDRQPAVPFLHDTTTKNVIVTAEGAFSGIVDVDDLCFGDPRYVLALTLASLTVSGGPRGYVEAWMQAAGFADDPLFRLYVALFFVDFMSEHGQVFNGNARPSVPADRRRLLELFAAALDRVGA